jgi:uncharacterized membrane protein
MFTFILFLAVIVIFYWAWSRFYTLEQRLEGLERKLKEVRTAPKPAQESIPVKPAPSMPSPAEAQPATMPPAVPWPPPRIEAPPVPVADTSSPEASPLHTPTRSEAPPVAPPFTPPPSPLLPSWKMPKFDWENLVGVKLFSWIAGVALLLAAVFFLRYSISQGWLMPPVRMTIGIIVGVGLLILCELKAARKYPVTANAMDASAIAILFSTFFAARVLWDLINPVAAFGLMVLVAAVAVLLSIRRDSIFIALLGLVGGFATPALLSTGENRPISLFTYILLLNAGLAWVAIQKKWPMLTLLSFVFTVFYQWGWVVKFLTAAQLPIALGIFLIFPVLAFAALTLGQRSETRKSWMSLYEQAGNLSALLPLLFALYMAAVPGYGYSFGLLFGFLFLLDAGLFAIAIARGPETLHLAGGLSTILIWAIWLSSSYEERAWPSIIGFIVLFALYYLATPFIARRYGHDFASPGKSAIYTTPLILFVMPCLATMEPACASPWILFGALFLILFAASAYAIYAEEGAIYYIAAAFALLAETAWSIKHLTPEHLYSGLALYAIFGLFFIGVPMAAKHLHKRLLLEKFGVYAFLSENGIFLGLTGHVFLMAIAAQNSLGVPPWPLLGILLVLDLAVGAAALYLRRDILHRAAMVASGLILIVWVDSAELVPWPDVAVFSAGALVLLSLIWIYLANRMGIDATSFSRTAAITIVLAQFVPIFSSAQRGTPGVEFLLAAHLILLVALLALEWYRGTFAFSVIAVLPAALAVSFWSGQHSDPGFWPQLLLFCVPIYMAFIIYPLLLGRRMGSSIAPCLAAVLASIPFFFEARLVIINAGWEQAIGILPIVQALLLSLVLMRLLKIEPPSARHLERLALVAGAALAFVTAAIPLQLEKEWITIGWALEGAALAWLYSKIPHKGLLYFASGLFAAVFIRLALNPSILIYQPRSEIRIWNWYLYTYIVSSAAMILGGRLLSRTKDALLESFVRVSKLLPAGAVILMFLLLNIEIADFYSAGRTIEFNFTATLAQDLTYTLGWAAFAVSLLAAGIMLRNQPARIASLALLVVTIFKCFFHDLARLGGLYRVASFVGLAVCLALVALVLQKFVLSARTEEK